jgi:hypothetical protein
MIGLWSRGIQAVCSPSAQVKSCSGPANKTTLNPPSHSNRSKPPDSQPSHTPCLQRFPCLPISSSSLEERTKSPRQQRATREPKKHVIKHTLTRRYLLFLFLWLRVRRYTFNSHEFCIEDWESLERYNAGVQKGTYAECSPSCTSLCLYWCHTPGSPGS